MSFPLGLGVVTYQVCSECAGRAAREGLLGVPTLMQDCRLSPWAARRTKVTVTALTTGSESGEDWWDILECRADATVATINSQYRARARSAHPDAGGSDAAMVRLNAARDAALAAQVGAR